MDVKDSGKNNTIIGQPTPNSSLTVEILGRDNVVVLGSNAHFVKGSIVLRGNNQTFEIAGENRIIGRFILSGHNSSVYIGEGTRSNSTVWMNLGERGDSIRIGNNCLFASVAFRTSDSHPIYDVQTGERINPSSPIILHDRVWLAEDVLVLKGANIGADSVIGARALVAGDIPPNSLAVGVPAKVIRSGIRWQRRPD